MPPLVEIGLIDLTKSGGARAPPAPPLATGLVCDRLCLCKKGLRIHDQGWWNRGDRGEGGTVC